MGSVYDQGWELRDPILSRPDSGMDATCYPSRADRPGGDPTLKGYMPV